MKKTKLFVLLGLIVSSFPLLINGSFETAPVFAEGGEDELMFEEVQSKEYDCNGYKCTNYTPVDIIENFQAPNGSIFRLASTNEKLNKIGDYIRTLPDFSSGRIKYAYFLVKRNVDGLNLFSDVEFAYDFSIDALTDFINVSMSHIVLYEIEEKIISFDIDCSFTLTVYPEDDEAMGYELTFDTDSYHVEPYKNGDFIHLSLVGYDDYNENRININPEVNMDLFNEKYGFKTDGRTPKEYWQGDGYNEKYSIDIIDKETNVILGTGESGLQMDPVPKKPVTIFARLSFFADGEKYTFYSNEVVAQEMMPGALLDGFDNRDTIGLKDETQHKLTLLTAMPLDEIESFSISLYYEENSELCTIGLHEFDKKYGGEDAYTALDESFFTFDLKFTKAKEYTICANIRVGGPNFHFYSENRWNKVIKVVEGKVEHISDINEALVIDAQVEGKSIEQTINEKNEINIFCVVGGKPIDIYPNIPADLLNTNEVPTFKINEETLPGFLKAKVEDEGRKITVIPSGEGSGTMVVSSLIKGFGLVEKKINFKVITDVSSIASLSAPKEFHYSLKPLTVKMEFTGAETIANLAVEWKVTNSEDEVIEFVDNNDFSITLDSPVQGDYKIVASLNGFEICSTIVEVRDFNVDKFVQDNIWWLFLVAVSILALAICAKLFLTKKNTIIEQLRNIYTKLESVNILSDDCNKQLAKVKLLLQAGISYSNDLNMDGMNQYEKTIRYLNKTIEGVKRMEKCNDTEAKVSLFEQTKKDLNKAILVVTDIQNAKAIAEANSLKANTNNYAKVEKEKK